MTAVLDMRDRIAAAAQQALRDRGMASGSDIAFAIADLALGSTRFEALVNYTVAVETGADPAAFRDELLTDPLFENVIIP